MKVTGNDRTPLGRRILVTPRDERRRIRGWTNDITKHDDISVTPLKNAYAEGDQSAIDQPLMSEEEEKSGLNDFGQ